MNHKVFIIYGRDIQAYRELVKYVECLGLENLSFNRMADKPDAMVIDIVIQGIEKADVVLALFTPDEHAALYGTEGVYHGAEENQSRWQARPNVLFEAGIAYGIKRQRTILLTLGAGVRLFSDLSGVHYVNLATDDAKDLLKGKIEAAIQAKLKAPEKWKLPTKSGNFIRCLRRRWPHFDDVNEMQDQLRHQDVGKGSDETYLEVVQKAVSRAGDRDWSRVSVKDFMLLIERDAERRIANSAYWQLFHVGAIRFFDVDGDRWYDEDGNQWRQCEPYAEFTERGRQMMLRLSLILPRRDRTKPPASSSKGLKVKKRNSRQIIPWFITKIIPERVRQGQMYTTHVHYIGDVKNGFYDNHVVHMDSDFHKWNWDPKTLVKMPGLTLNTSPGLLNGSIDHESTYTHSTAGWPLGRYKIHIGLYAHRVPGEKGRDVVAEAVHDFEVY